MSEAFILVYLIAVIVIGQATRSNAIDAFARLASATPWRRTE
jgi:hypothetical protein